MVGELSNFSHAVLEVIVSGNPNHFGSGGPSSGVLQLAHLSGNGCIALTSSTGYLSIRTDTIPNGNPFNHGSEKVRIKSNGRVGVGTDDPNTTLSVYGSVNAVSYTHLTLPTTSSV